MSRSFLRYLLAISIAQVAWASSVAAQAQDSAALMRSISAQAGRDVSTEEVIERLRASGLSRAQVRARLQAAGYDPRLADEYFDAMERGTSAQASQSEKSRRVLRALGDLLRTPEMDSLSPLPLDSLPVSDSALATGSRVFGRDVFLRSTTEFQPLTTGPVDPAYVLGPGDELLVVLSGDVELAHSVDVTREGTVVVPEVGQVSVQGLTLDAVESLLASRFDAVYTGVGRDADAPIRIRASLGRLRTNLIYLVGAVERPGSYQVSSVATVFNALYQAGGPTDQGSFRRIEVRRGGKVVGTIDLYKYLLHGDTREDIRLQQGDVIYVPLASRQVLIEGAVRRPAMFEVLSQESMDDLVGFAGGFKADAVISRVLIDRILPAERRQPGVSRVLVDVDVSTLTRGEGQGIALQDGDKVQVFTLAADEVRNRVFISGEVRRPGQYQWAQGTTLWALIGRAEGLADKAYTPRAHIFRLDPEDGSRRVVRTPLLADSTGRVIQDVALEDRDSVVIYSREELRTPKRVTIDGYVKRVGVYDLADGMSLRDLILATGGFNHGADMTTAEVARLQDPHSRTETRSVVHSVRLMERPDSGLRFSAIPIWLPDAEEFELQDGDHVFVRRAPGFEPHETIRITGEVATPGTYVLSTRQEKLLDVLNRAGGLTPEAFAPGLQIVRSGKLVATDLPLALRSPSSPYNLVIEPGDSLNVPKYDGTILVTGAVTFESRVLYKKGANLNYYLNRAGGMTDRADSDRITVTYQDGERAAVNRSLLFLKSHPKPEPGATIFVPEKPAEIGGIDWDKLLTRTVGVMSAVGTFIIAVDRINN